MGAVGISRDNLPYQRHLAQYIAIPIPFVFTAVNECESQQIGCCAEENDGGLAQALVNLASESCILSSIEGRFFEFNREEDEALLLSFVKGSGIKCDRGLGGGGDLVACHLKNQLHGLRLFAKLLFGPCVLIWRREFTNKVVHTSC